MYNVRKVTEDIVWVGASDRRLALFENIFPIPRGVSYNSYVLLDEKTVLLDTVDASVAGQFFENLEHVLDGRKLDYLIVNEDRHLNNFGLIRNAVTLEWVGVAPLYDNGNSMWFNRVVGEMHADDDSNIKTPLWKKNPTENLELVTDFSWLDLSALDGIEDFVRELYEKSEYMEPIRVDTLANALRTRIELLDDIVQTQSGGQTMLSSRPVTAADRSPSVCVLCISLR